jgi:hypothetical protein
MFRMERCPGAAFAVLAALLAGCAGPLAGLGNERKLEAIPPLPEGFVPLPWEATGFRSARIETQYGEWRINFDDGITKIETSPYVVTKLGSEWYPQEGGADAALCRGYRRGKETLVRMEGSSDMVTEETRIFFEGSKLREVVKYSIPGKGLHPDFPPDPIPYSQRVKREKF